MLRLSAGSVRLAHALLLEIQGLPAQTWWAIVGQLAGEFTVHIGGSLCVVGLCFAGATCRLTPLFVGAFVCAALHPIDKERLKPAMPAMPACRQWQSRLVLRLSAGGGKVQWVQSDGECSCGFANLPVENLAVHHLSPPPEKFWSMMAYNNAKLCNVLFAQELAQRWKQRGISVFSLHPGNMVSSDLSRNYWFYRLLFAIVRPFTKSLQQAAATSVYCATANELTGLSGLYFNNCFFCEPSKLSKSAALQQQLWRLSENLIAEFVQEQH
ncbi:WW domain-containing oxidoreductase isoform X2 [Drosophila erecta]|uniref:WW domain-containing oxidoreductase isoform X2 n=1 Tax=Drosophila erecta TaxID=7220 RepID=UPI000F04A838|nr:WW domain-containing oxidoreductase isoform X2 [Drosophila erecta]